MAETETTDTFPIEWNAWRAEWVAWLEDHGAELERVPKAIPGRNFMADEILGTFRVSSGRRVELSEVTFPNLSERDPETGRLLDHRNRYVGMVWVDTRQGPLVGSWAELERELGLERDRPADE